MSHRPAFPSSSVTRRGVLALIGLGVTTASVPSLAGCASDKAAAPAVTGAPTGKARRGGTARLAFAGAGASESLDPTVGTSPCDLARYSVLFDTLFSFTDGEAKPALATAAEVDSKAKRCTLTLRKGVKWHDGTSFTAADVVHTLKYRASPDRVSPSELSAYFDLASAKAGDDDHTVLVPTRQPVGDPATLFAGAGLYVIKRNTDSFTAKSTVGTGPYRLTSFKAGTETRLERFDGYWDGGGPADKVVLLSVDDAQARVNAVRDGQADYASDISFATAKAGAPGTGLQIRDAGKDLRTTYGFVLNVGRTLPSDPRVREAIKLGIDREALVKAVFLGYGKPANDLFGAGAKYYLDDVPVPERDVAKAKRLLKKAGATGKPFVVRTAEYESGLNSSAELFVEQLKELGLDASLVKVSTTQGYDPAGMKACDAISFPLGPVSLALAYSRSAAFETLAFPDKELQGAVAEAISTTSDSARADAWAKAQRVMADRGNWIAWGRADVLSLAKAKLTGIENRESPKYPWLGKVGFTA
ncbi:ABC transporter substrate-binding protein [Streptomyces sp. PU-14G]|uniref:ABC transporter substrate-binding protein n=1 Tax=Streptomyces sp. PU-14G TaxID=2800808 RepID=UPI0034DF101D